MAKVTYIEHDGAEHTVDVADGTSVMQAALDNNVQGIVGECGGGMACATCHCYIDEAWSEKVGPASEVENDMLEFAASQSGPNSRLSCQVTVTDELDGLVVRLPETQY